MVPRTVSVSVTVNTGGFTSGMAKVASSAQAAAASVKASFDKGLGSITKSAPHLDKIGSSLGKIGAVGAVGLGLSAKAAIDWESSFAGVMKTTNDSAAGFKLLEGELRGLAKTMPATHKEIAATAEAAGQLGVSRAGLVPFVKTMIELGDTTNLSAEEAATSLAQLMNVMGTAPSQVGALGDAIVNLGNNGASTERDIVQMGQRISGAGKQIGLSENQVLAFASAISSTGIQTEAGGTAISQTFQKIDKAVAGGGKSLGILAKTAGVSSQEFSQAWGQDAAAATQQFIDGLAKVQAAGGNASTVLDSLGITGQRQQDVLLRLAGATKIAGAQTDLLADSFKAADQSAGALGAEAAKRYQTTASQIKISLNNIQDAGITAGGAILPVLSNLATGAAGAAQAFGNLSAPVQGFAVKGVAFATAAALIGAGAIKAVTGVAALRTAMVGISATAPAAAAGLRGLGLAAVGIAGVMVGLQAVGAVTRQFKDNFVPNITSANKALLDLGTTGSQVNLDKMFSFDISGFGNDALKGANGIHGLSEALALLKDPSGLDQVRVGIDKVINTTGQLTSVNKAFEGLDQSLTGLSAGGHADQAAASFDKLRTAATAQGVPLDKLISLFPQYKQAILATAEANKFAITSDEQLADIMGGKLPAGFEKAAAGSKKVQESVKGMSFDEQQASIDGAIASLNRYANAALAVSSGTSGLEGAIDAANAALKENGKTLNQNTAAGRANQGALDQLSGAAQQNAAAMTKAGASQSAINAATGRARNAFQRTAQGMGLSSRAARALAVDLIRIPNAKNVRIVTTGAKISQSQAAELNHELKRIPAEKRARIVTIAETKGVKAARTAMAQLKDKTVIARSRGDLKGAHAVKSAMAALKDRLVLAKARGDKKGADAVRTAMNALKNRTVTAGTKADTSGARAAQSAVDSVHGKTVTVVVNTVRTGSGRTRGDAAGGYIQGPGTSTSDSIPAWLSDGEVVIKAASVRAIGVERLLYANAMGQLPKFKEGGTVGFAKGGKAKDPAAGGDFDREIRVVLDLQQQLEQARTVKESIAVTKKLAAANKKLYDSQTAIADGLKAMSASLIEPYRTKSKDIDDWLEAMKEGTSDLTAFKNNVKSLRKLGVSETLIKQISEQGALAGNELAEQILQGGKGLANSLNLANKRLEDAAKNAGGAGSIVKGYASGGPISGAGSGISDSITVRASDGEYLVNARATAANRSVLDAINFGRTVIDHRFVPHFAYGGQVQRPVTRPEVKAGDVIIKDSQFGASADQVAAKIMARQRDSQIMAGLTVAV